LLVFRSRAFWSASEVIAAHHLWNFQAIEGFIPRADKAGTARKTTMKIAQIAPLIESVPPRLYGGTERIVSYLTEELVALGHDVTLFASGDSITAANLVPCVPKALRLDASVRDTIPYYMLMLDRVRQRADDFDVLHFHIDQFHFPLFRSMAGRTVTTLHGRQDLPDLFPLYAGFDEMPLVSISNDQRRPVPRANFAATVYHGLPALLHRPSAGSNGSYVAFLGRISPEKRPDRAISIARALGIPLKIAAKVDRADEVYFRTQIEPLLDEPGVEFIGEINEHQKTQFLGEAQALLFPVDWPEPFGLSMIEAMACGTPVLAFRCGSVPEIIEDGLTGAIVDTMEQAIVALPNVIALDRKKFRQRFEQRFSATRMAKDYVDVYRSLLASSRFLSGEERDIQHRLPNGKDVNNQRPYTTSNLA
jgi:glycosyltransferase involved in cell wall biosynthesis